MKMKKSKKLKNKLSKMKLIYKEENQNLKNKIKELQNKIKELAKDNSAIECLT